jgi:hypothetical protein
MLSSRILLLIVVLIGTVQCSCQNGKPSQLKTYVVNLDLDPYLRFQEISRDYKDAMIALVNAQKLFFFFSFFLVILIDSFFFFLRKIIDPVAIPILEYIASDVDNYLPYPFNEELKGY